MWICGAKNTDYGKHEPYLPKNALTTGNTCHETGNQLLCVAELPVHADVAYENQAGSVVGAIGSPCGLGRYN